MKKTGRRWPSPSAQPRRLQFHQTQAKGHLSISTQNPRASRTPTLVIRLLPQAGLAAICQQSTAARSKEYRSVPVEKSSGASVRRAQLNMTPTCACPPGAIARFWHPGQFDPRKFLLRLAGPCATSHFPKAAGCQRAKIGSPERHVPSARVDLVEGQYWPVQAGY